MIYEDGENSEPIDRSGRNEEFVLGHIKFERLVHSYLGMRGRRLDTRD